MAVLYNELSGDNTFSTGVQQVAYCTRRFIDYDGHKVQYTFLSRLVLNMFFPRKDDHPGALHLQTSFHGNLLSITLPHHSHCTPWIVILMTTKHHLSKHTAHQHPNNIPHLAPDNPLHTPAALPPDPPAQHHPVPPPAAATPTSPPHPCTQDRAPHHPPN